MKLNFHANDRKNKQTKKKKHSQIKSIEPMIVTYCKSQKVHTVNK